MSLDTFIVVDPCTNKFFAACDAYLVDTRKLSGEEYNALFDYPSPKTQEILNKHGMSLDSCEYHKIMECAEEIEETMQIDLEEFVNNEVVITNNSDGISRGTMTMSNHERFPYQLYTEDGAYLYYNREGYNLTADALDPYNIKHIELKQPQQSQKAMTQQLSDATIKKLADALTDDAIVYLETDEEVIETLVSVLNRFLTDRMGQMDETLLGKLSVTILENFDLVSDNK